MRWRHYLDGHHHHPSLLRLLSPQLGHLRTQNVDFLFGYYAAVAATVPVPGSHHCYWTHKESGLCTTWCLPPAEYVLPSLPQRRSSLSLSWNVSRQCCCWNSSVARGPFGIHLCMWYDYLVWRKSSVCLSTTKWHNLKSVQLCHKASYFVYRKYFVCCNPPHPIRLLILFILGQNT